MNWIPRIIREHEAQLRTIRRHLHRNPEIGHQEFETVNYLAQQIAGFGVREIKKPAPTSLSITIGPSRQSAIAFRADLDALPILEENEHPFKSKRDGLMHACGHDVHTTIVLGLIPILLRAEPDLRRSVKLIFQQAEEVVPSGAPDLIAGGVLEDPAVCEIYGIHVWPHLELGKIGVKFGALMGSLDGITILIQSREPADTHERAGGQDAIITAAGLIKELESVFGGRSLSDAKPASLLIGVINGGVSPSRFADNVVVKGSLRALHEDARRRALAELEAIAMKLRQTTATDITIEVNPMIRPFVVNSTQCLDRVCDAVRQMPDCSIHYLENPLSCSDDFGWYLERVPGAYVQLGSMTNPCNAYPLHNARFEVDEKVIETGVSLLAHIALGFATR